jgi:NAD(P)-dependent dehydrogenase (short-subunit alcohol dehydrogenase family)
MTERDVPPGEDGAPRASGDAALSREELASCVRMLEALCGNRALLASVDAETRQRLLIAAGRLSRPERAEMRELAKAFRRRERAELKASDERILEATGMRRQRLAPVFPTPPPLPLAPPPASEPRGEEPELGKPRKCYVCKAEYRRVHAFYHSMCTPCAELNWQKRHQSTALDGRVAVVTGARVKIGYHIAIMLLRAGARVIATTRFPRDAAARYAAEPDFATWRDRLSVHGLDLRHTPSVEIFAAHLDARLEQLDFLVNNACQTVRRPPGFYAHLVDAESAAPSELPAGTRALLQSHEGLIEHASATEHPLRFLGMREAARLSQLPSSPEDRSFGPEIFPAGRLDQDLQQIDLRDRNSWRLTLGEVPTVELLEVQLVNAVAPFVLASKLKRLMMQRSGLDRHIVNVSAVEGQFYRPHKTDKHPHTNMAKAALNMLTRTSAADYVEVGIHMNSVDTGWITDEDPAALASRKVEEHGFHPPLDVVDGAARVLDPVFTGLSTGRHPWGQFFKDYRPAEW